MWKNAAITGTIVDEAGEPVVALQVRAVRRMFIGGRRRFVPSGALATTDDRGVYRLSGLPPGEYLVAASQPTFSANTSAFADIRTARGAGAELAWRLPPGAANGIQVGQAQLMLGRGGAIPPPPVRGRMQIYPPIFYPSALAPAQATTIALASGEERIGIDLQLQPVPTVRVAGTLMGASGPAGTVDAEVDAGRTLRRFRSGNAGADQHLRRGRGVHVRGGSARAVHAPGQQPRSPRRARRRGGDMYWLDMPIAVGG